MTPDNWQPHFDLATDWYRYTGNCWLVWTTGNAESWHEYLRRFLPEQDYLFIVEIPLGAPFRGYLPKRAWEWIGKYRVLRSQTKG